LCDSVSFKKSKKKLDGIAEWEKQKKQKQEKKSQPPLPLSL
jgi:hypothetical protein